MKFELFTPAWKSENAQRRAKALDGMKEEKLLAIVRDPSEDTRLNQVRGEAVQRLSPKALAEVALDAKVDTYLRNTAIRRVDDEQVLLAYLRDPTAWRPGDALERMRTGKLIVENTMNRARFMTIPTLFEDFASIFNNPMKKLSEMENFNVMNPLTCEGSWNGAGILFCQEYLKAIREKIGDYYIIPSSIHEVLIVPNDGTMDINDLNFIVQDVNANEVSENDYLADRAFTVDEWI